MLFNDFLRPNFADLNKDLSLRYLTQALPGLAISLRNTKQLQRLPPWECKRSADTMLGESSKLEQQQEWSDTESNYASDSEWPDWSRWSQRKLSLSSSHTSVDLNLASEEEYTTENQATTAPIGTTNLKGHSNSGDQWLPGHHQSDNHHSSSNSNGESNTNGHKQQNQDSHRELTITPSVMGRGCSSSSCHAKTCNHVAALHPAKTGFALWVGNLGPKTSLLDLRVLFGTPDLQSIYLIQRTGCAFVNYNNEAALEEAIKLFDSRGGRLHDHDLVIKAQYTNEEPSTNNNNKQPAPTSESVAPHPEPMQLHASNSPNRYFICKSLLVDDLEQAKQTGLWSTQLRNKERFNQAFYNSENTYLVFSANRTSAFYGIARLETPFKEAGGCCTDANSKESALAVQPEIKHTPSFIHPQDGVEIPAGDTVLDPLRGSQFWKVCGCVCVEPEVEKWTAPAKIRWLSSSNSIVPFSRTRQLKNSLNMNKPIKVARDGTEIDPEVGEKLCKMFD